VKSEAHDGQFFELEDEQKMHSECYPRHLHEQAPNCVHCGEKIVEGSYSSFSDGRSCHEACMEPYEEALAPKCVMCSKGIRPLEGVFSGAYYSITEGDANCGAGPCHKECYDAETSSKAPAPAAEGERPAGHWG